MTASAAYRRRGAAERWNACPAWRGGNRCWPRRCLVADAQTRSPGTLCGSVAHADPSAELPLVLVALRGTIHLGSRVIIATFPQTHFSPA